MTLCFPGKEGLCLTLAYEVTSFPFFLTCSWTCCCVISSSPHKSFGYFFPSFTLPQKVIELMLECLCPPSILRTGIMRSAAVPFPVKVCRQCKRRRCFFFLFPFLVLLSRVIFRSCEAGRCCNAVHVAVLLQIQCCGLHWSISFNLAWSLLVEYHWFENIPCGKKEKNRLFSKLHHKAIARST